MRKLWTATMAFVLLSGTCALAFEHADPHYASPRTSPVVRQSTFLHGYLHGYEEGYSAGDMDLQMARALRDPAKMKEAHPSGYRSEFGTRHAFDAGYRQGFRVGYADSVAGRTFRAINVIQQAMALTVNPVMASEPQVQAVAPPPPRVPHTSALLDEVAALGFGPRRQVKAAPAPRHESAPPAPQEPVAGPSASPFDQGFADGYTKGQRRGVTDARSAVPFGPPSAACPAGLFKAAQGLESCTAYLRGFTMGYSDGYINVAPPTSASASQSK